MQKNTVKYDQLIQAGRDAYAVLELAKKADTRISRQHETTQRAGAVWYLSRRRGLNISLHDLYAIYGKTPGAIMLAFSRIQRAVLCARVFGTGLEKREDPGDGAVEKWRPSA